MWHVCGFPPAQACSRMLPSEGHFGGAVGAGASAGNWLVNDCFSCSLFDRFDHSFYADCFHQL